MSSPESAAAVIGQAWKCFVKHNRAVYENPHIALAERIRVLNAEVIEVILYGCVTWTMSPNNFGTLREARRRFLLRRLDERISTLSVLPTAICYHTARSSR